MNLIINKENDMYFKKDFVGYGVAGFATSSKKPTGMTIHDYAGGMGVTAQSGAKAISDRMKANEDNANVQWVVDDKGSIYSIVSENSRAYHAGDGATGTGNGTTLSVEITPSLTGGSFANQTDIDRHYNAWLNACKLAADCAVKYGFNENNIHQHREFYNTACPYSIMKNPKIGNGSYTTALSKTRAQVKTYIAQIKGTTSTTTPTPAPSTPTSSTKHKVGEQVSFKGYYASSEATGNLNNAISSGKITQIQSGAKAPYLINGGTGWTSDSLITSGTSSGTTSSAKTYKVGSKVKVKQGAKFTNGATPIPSVYSTTYYINQINGSTSLISPTTNGSSGYTGWFKNSDLILV